MHKFLRAIGFSDIKKKDLDSIIDEIIEKPEVMRVTRDSDGYEFAELSEEVAPNIGLKVIGSYIDDSDEFEIDHVFPYFSGTDLTTEDIVTIEKHTDNESYAGICDDPIIGVTLIFYLLNSADYLSEQKSLRKGAAIRGAYLSCLSTEGKILLPMYEKTQAESERDYKKQNDRKKLIAQAREGDAEAIENLTLEDMSTYSLISRRIMKEDILSIVTTSFMPYGIECDQYSIVATILEHRFVRNGITNEGLHCMKVECNDLVFEICINEKDLIGEPAVGRRFKGNVWMQGNINL